MTTQERSRVYITFCGFFCAAASLFGGVVLGKSVYNFFATTSFRLECYSGILLGGLLLLVFGVYALEAKKDVQLISKLQALEAVKAAAGSV